MACPDPTELRVPAEVAEQRARHHLTTTMRWQGDPLREVWLQATYGDRRDTLRASGVTLDRHTTTDPYTNPTLPDGTWDAVSDDMLPRA